MDKKLKFVLGILLCCICNRSEAALSSLSVSVSVPQQEDFSDLPISFQKFDPTLGKLSSVEIILQGTGEMTQQFENRAHSKNSARIRQKVLFTLTLPNANNPLLSATQTEKHKYTAGPFDGTTDFGGPSGNTSVYDVTASDDTVLQSKKNLALFTGSDLGEMFLSSNTSFHIASSKSASFAIDALTGADITIIYNFITIPEPVWFGGLAGGLALICALRFRTQRRDE